VLFEQNADRYFVPASNMKLFTTALRWRRSVRTIVSEPQLESRGASLMEKLRPRCTLVAVAIPIFQTANFRSI
jgi:D-alanyl-D-alanine carboxypeptidase